jgi:hypothetical protein
MTDIVDRLKWWAAKSPPPRRTTLPADCAEAADEIERLRSALAPLVPSFTEILAEFPRDADGSDEYIIAMDCEGNEYCVTLDQIRAVVEIVRK